MRKSLIVTITFAAILPWQSSSLAFPAPDALKILEAVDAYRNPFDSFAVDVELKSLRRDQTAESWNLRVFGRDGDKSLVEFLSPAIEKGKYLLMLRDAMWIYLPNTSRPIRISPQQRLMGDASNGDVARTNYAVDYEAIVSGEEKLEGKELLVLELAARDSRVAYTRIKLWVHASDYRPVHAEYYVTSGKLLKRVFFRSFTLLNGRPVVEELEIHDAARPDRQTVMTYTNLHSRDVSERLFNKDYLGRW